MSPKSAAETADYVRAQIKELVKLSSESGLHVLAYMLEIAGLEAASQAEKKDD